MIAQLTQVYNNVLKRDCSSLVGQIDANAIAKNGDIDCVKRLVILDIYCSQRTLNLACRSSWCWVLQCNAKAKINSSK